MEDQIAKFQQKRWEFRNAGSDSDSSSDDSRPALTSPVPSVEKHEQISNSIPIVNDELNATSRVLQQKENEKKNDKPQVETEIKPVNAKKKRPRTSKSDKPAVSNSKKRTIPTKGAISRKKKKFKIDDNAGLDDLKKFMESLLEGLKVTRESLLIWMKEEMSKLLADDDVNLGQENTVKEKIVLSEKSDKVMYENIAHRNLRNVQYQKNVVLAIEAQNCRGESSKKSSAKGKMMVKPVDQKEHVSEDVCYKQEKGPYMFSNEKVETETFFNPSTFTSNPFPQQVDLLSMYSTTLPTIPMFDNNPSFNYIHQPRVVTNDGSFNPGRQQSQMINPNILYGYNQSEEHVKMLAQTDSRMMNGFDRYRMANCGGIVPGLSLASDHGIFNIPNHQVALENLSQQNNGNVQGLRMSGGAIKLSRGSYGLEEHHLANYLHGQLNYRME
ncbi:hypothetical protein ACFE04_014516 [Oxalis oulophora]